MKKNHRLSSVLCVLAVLLTFLAITYHVSAVTCVNPSVTGKAAAWANGVTVVVNVSGFAAALQPCVKTAFDNWNAASIDNGSNVLLHVQYGTPFNTTGQSNVWQVTQQTPAPNPTTGEPRVAATGGQTNSTNRVNANTSIDPNVTDCTALTETTAHEIGHTFGLGECSSSSCTAPQQSVMIGIPCAQRDTTGKCVVPAWNDTTWGLPGPTSCDTSTVKGKIYTTSGGGIPGCQTDCPANSHTCVPCGPSPIILDITGQGFNLTNAQNGVSFDISGSGTPIQLAWTTPGSSNAFLALPGLDGLVHNGKQLFGNFTPQPPSNQPNGFAALAVYDDPANGGNGDGLIDSRDAVFNSLRLWIDANHDGVSQPTELYTLPSLGVNSISLNYKWDDLTDQYGNVFRFRSKVNADNDVGKKAYDVFFVTLNPIVRNNGCIVPRVMAKAGL